MCEPSESSQLKLWLFTSENLYLCRKRANRVARKALSASAAGFGGATASINSDAAAAAAATTDVSAPHTDSNATAESGSSSAAGGDASSQQLMAESFARDFNMNKDKWLKDHECEDDGDDGPWQTKKGHIYATPEEEAAIVSFYVSKLPNLIGPKAQVPRLRRESKVTATAALLLRRFYLSNSVMMFDPKTIMVAAAFLASKVEDATTDVRYLEEGTNLMNSPVSQTDIIPSEIHLLSGIQFDLLCFHPYKAVLAVTEDLRTYLKSKEGRSLVHFPNSSDTHRPIVGQDLLPMHDAAQQLVDDVIVSDIPLLYPPGQVGLAALMVANERQQEEYQQNVQRADNNDKNAAVVDVPQIDFFGYISLRFPDKDQEEMKSLLRNLCAMLREVREGKHGCGNHNVDLQMLKSVHKKLKKTAKWSSSSSSNKEKKKKRKASSSGGGNDERDGPDTKRAKT